MTTMTGKGTATVTLPTDEQILITRAFNAPKRLVYKAYTTPELVKRWWSADMGETTVVEIDLRVGGSWRYVMRTPDGSEVGFHGEYREIVPNERMDRLNRGLRGDARGGGGQHRNVYRGKGAHNPHHPRAAHQQGTPRRAPELRDGGRYAEGAELPRAGRALASLSRKAYPCSAKRSL